MVLLAANPLTVSSFGRQACQSYLSQQCSYTPRQGHVCACEFVCVFTVCVLGRRQYWGWGLSTSSQKAQFKGDLNKGVTLSYNTSVLFYFYGFVSGLSRRFVTNIMQVWL